MKSSYYTTGRDLSLWSLPKPPFCFWYLFPLWNHVKDMKAERRSKSTSMCCLSGNQRTFPASLLAKNSTMMLYIASFIWRLVIPCVCVCMRECACECVCVVCVCACVCVCVCLFAMTHRFTEKQIHSHTHTHTHTHPHPPTHTHTHTHTEWERERGGGEHADEIFVIHHV